MRDGRMANAQLTNYLVPTTLDVPPFDVTLLESASRHGPYGAKGRRRDADERTRARGRERGAPPRPRRPLAPDHPGEGPGMRFILNGRRTDVDAPPLKRLARRPARGLLPHRDEGGLRRGRVRRLHGAARRHAGQLLPRAARARARTQGDDDRGAARAQAGDARPRGRRAVRHLHARHPDGGRDARPAPDRGSRARGARRQPLPVHGLRGDRASARRDPRGAAATRAQDRGDATRRAGAGHEAEAAELSHGRDALPALPSPAPDPARGAPAAARRGPARAPRRLHGPLRRPALRHGAWPALPRPPAPGRAARHPPPWRDARDRRPRHVHGDRPLAARAPPPADPGRGGARGR